MKKQKSLFNHIILFIYFLILFILSDVFQLLLLDYFCIQSAKVFNMASITKP